MGWTDDFMRGLGRLENVAKGTASRYTDATNEIHDPSFMNTVINQIPLVAPFREVSAMSDIPVDAAMAAFDEFAPDSWVDKKNAAADDITTLFKSQKKDNSSAIPQDSNLEKQISILNELAGLQRSQPNGDEVRRIVDNGGVITMRPDVIRTPLGNIKAGDILSEGKDKSFGASIAAKGSSDNFWKNIDPRPPLSAEDKKDKALGQNLAIIKALGGAIPTKEEEARIRGGSQESSPGGPLDIRDISPEFITGQIAKLNQMAEDEDSWSGEEIAAAVAFTALAAGAAYKFGGKTVLKSLAPKAKKWVMGFLGKGGKEAAEEGFTLGEGAAEDLTKPLREAFLKERNFKKNLPIKPKNLPIVEPPGKFSLGGSSSEDIAQGIKNQFIKRQKALKDQAFRQNLPTQAQEEILQAFRQNMPAGLSDTGEVNDVSRLLKDALIREKGFKGNLPIKSPGKFTLGKSSSEDLSQALKDAFFQSKKAGQAPNLDSFDKTFGQGYLEDLMQLFRQTFLGK